MSPSLPKAYKAVISPAPHKPFEVVERKLRDLQPTEVLIRVHASGICNSDHFVHEGSWPGLSYPLVPGHEVIGRIAAVGSELKDDMRLKEGSLVGVGWNGGWCGKCEWCRKGQFSYCVKGAVTGFTQDGGHAEYMYASETSVISVPEEALKDATYAELAPLFCAGTTVFDAIRHCTWAPGDICLVQGIGGLGHLAVQMASRMGLKVIACSSGSSKRDLALSLGATEYLDSSATDVPAYLQSLGGAVLVLCTAPYAKHINSILPAVAKDGTIMLVSAATDGKIEVDNLFLNMNRASLRGWSCRAAPDSEQMVKFSAEKGVKALVQEFKIEDFEGAYQGVVANQARFRNVVVFP